MHLSIKRLSCENCDYLTARKGDLQSHKMNNHKEEEQDRLNCMIWGKKFIIRQMLVKHVKVKQICIRYKCNLCCSDFTESTDLTRHIATVHLGIKEHACNYCESTFILENNLKVHFNTVHLKMKPFKWTFTMCDNNLKQHITSVHGREKNFKCTMCHKAYPGGNRLKIHIKNVHRGGKS